VFTYRAKEYPFTQDGGVANQVMHMFLDPADCTASKLRDVPMTLPDGVTGYYATGSYAANGLVPWGSVDERRKFPGGLANTVLFGERPQACRTAAGEPVYNLWGLGVYSPHMPAFAALTPADPPGLWDTGQVAPVQPLPDETAVDRDSLLRVWLGRRDAEPAPPDFPTPLQRVRPGGPCDPRLPGTPHRRGMQVVMADGSVRVFEPNTSPWVFWNACAPPGPPVGP
jgi:prepilin-type processing-associated H-X9-DG protein